MIALGIETTTDRLSLAAVGQNGSLAGRQVEGARKHAALLFPLIAEVLSELELRLEDVEALGVADGPGSFTGLRVGVAAAKALARAQPALSVWTASTLLVRAAAVTPPHGARVLVVTSALRGELYAATYRMDLPRGIETLNPPGLATPESLHGETPDLLVADAPEKLVDRLADQFAVPLVRGTASLPNAATLLALLGVPGGAEQIKDLANWEPSYGRPAEAQVRWEATHGRTLSHSSSVTR